MISRLVLHTSIIIIILFLLKVHQYSFKSLQKQRMTAVYEIIAKNITGVQDISKSAGNANLYNNYQSLNA